MTAAYWAIRATLAVMAILTLGAATLQARRAGQQADAAVRCRFDPPTQTRCLMHAASLYRGAFNLMSCAMLFGAAAILS